MEKKNKNSGGKICVICYKFFTSGKALGGHMRTHLAKLPIPPKPAPITPTTDLMPSKISKVDVDGGSSLIHQHSISSSPKSLLKMNSLTKQNFYSMNQDFAIKFSNPGDDQRSKSDQSYQTGKRSKRCRKIHDATRAVMLPPKTKANRNQTGLMFNSYVQVVDAALTLMILSKDKWPTRKELIEKKQAKGENEQEDSYAKVHSHGERFECETCNKVFRSYQALGGHKASHKKVFKNDQLEVDGEFDEEIGDDGNWGNNNDALKDPKMLKCLTASKCLSLAKDLEDTRRYTLLKL
ncbi:zinc finger protein ZAT4-like [Prosopis cineraria]|uniref:zinc finger protein ZAT4-like n=1 Tax=Prosopis cineraria TaxID=364024 RepID=UPI00240F53CC|nr:zinc finger protein ZAT4-like [Prosopis cineraria]